MQRITVCRRWLYRVLAAAGMVVSLANAASATQGFLYALNQVDGDANQIYGFRVNPATGALTLLPGFPVMTGGDGNNATSSEAIAYDAVNFRLYVINDGSDTLSAFSVNRTTGTLTPLPFSPISLNGGFWATVHVHPSGSPVVVGDGNDGSANGRIASFVVTASTATPAAGSPYTAVGASPFSTVFSADGNYLYAGGNVGLAASGFSVTAATGVLTPLPGSPFNLSGSVFNPGDGFPVGYVTDSSGRLFTVNARANQVRAFTTASGIPSAVTGNPFPAGGLTEGVAGLLHPSGFYIVADRIGNKVGVYRIAGSGATTTMAGVSGSPFASGGLFTDALAMSTDGGFVFAANGNSRNFSVFSVDGTTGAMTMVLLQAAGAMGAVGRITGAAFVQGASFGDFDGNGKGDLLLRNNSTGQNIGWLMNGLTVSTSAFLSTIADTNWEVRGRGDFNGDGKADVMWRNKSTGQDIGWLMNGLALSTSAFLPTIADTNWEIKGIADFNGDGKADVLLRNKTSGQNIGWLMNGLTVSTSAFLPTIADTNWDIVGVGDFDGDNKADVILRNTFTGQNIGWLMNALTVSTAAFLPTIADTTWEIKSVGDFDGDGRADVVWRNKVSGQNIGWLMNGLAVSTSAFMPTIADTNWDVKGAEDFDGNGKDDILLRNKATGQNIGWLMNGLTVSTSALLPTIADTNWDIVGQGQ
jgi:6-phosphogluconolactonase (cycloisomerase 2 family)